jgi:hypothetical protein
VNDESVGVVVTAFVTGTSRRMGRAIDRFMDITSIKVKNKRGLLNLLKRHYGW